MEGIGSLGAILRYDLEGGWLNDSVGVEFYALLYLCLSKGDGRESGGAIWQFDIVFAHCRNVVKAYSLYLNEFELCVTALLNRESNSVVGCATILCYHVDSGGLVETRAGHCDGLS